jgi:hypothetical protein
MEGARIPAVIELSLVAVPEIVAQDSNSAKTHYSRNYK